MVRLGSEAVSLDDLFVSAGVGVPRRSEGWAIAHTKGVDPAELTNRLAEESGEPTLAGWIYDSDFAYLAGVGSDERTFELLLGDPYETGEESAALVQDLEKLATQSGRAASAESLSSWSETNAARAISPETALAIVEEHAVFVEESLARLFEQLALPHLDTVLGQLR